MKKIFALLALLSCFFSSAMAEGTKEMEVYPVVILGGGIGALTSATYLARAGIPPLVITGPYPGGAIAQSHKVQNWPGEIEISGLALMEKMEKQAEVNGAILIPGIVTGIDFTKRPFTIRMQGIGQSAVREIKAQTCIVALGAIPNPLDVEGEVQYWAKGVYSCATCDGALYKGKTVAVIGGGDSALTDAQFLSQLCKKVYIIVRKDQFKTVEEKRKKEILARPNIEVLYETSVVEICGDGQKVTHLITLKDHAQEKLKIDGAFLALGATPNTGLLKGQIQLDSKRYIVLKNHQETSVPGVFAIGDVVDPEFKQAITAAGDGAKAALQVQKSLTNYVAPTSGEQKKKKAALMDGAPFSQIRSRAELDQALQQAEGPLFLYFTATWCPPCRTFSFQWQTWATEFHDRITFLKVDLDADGGLAQAYGVKKIPTLLILDKQGNVVRASLGLQQLAEVGNRLEGLKGQPAISADSFRH